MLHSGAVTDHPGVSGTTTPSAPSGAAPAAGAPPRHLRRGLGVLTLAATIFIFISSGPYGLEAMVREAGPGAAALMLVVALVFWGMSHALVASELASAVPEEGGFVRWIGMAFGDFWGFQAGWWYWIKMLADTSIYPILFCEYLKYWFPDLPVDGQRLVRLAVIWIFIGINLRGIRTGGRLAVLFTLFLLSPFLWFIVQGLPQVGVAAFTPFLAEGKPPLAALGTGLLIGMWCYNTLDSVSIVAGEVRDPTRTYGRAYALAIPVIVLTYLLPVIVGSALDPAYLSWEDHQFTKIGLALGGGWLGGWIALGGLASNLSIFHGALMVNTRVPFVLASARRFPRVFAALSERHGTPWVSLLFDGAVYSVIALMAESFVNIIIGIQWLNMGIYTLLYLAFLRLRRTRPDLPRRFTVPGGWPGALAICSGPFLICWIGIPVGGLPMITQGGLALLSGPIAAVVLGGFRPWRRAG